MACLTSAEREFIREMYSLKAGGLPTVLEATGPTGHRLASAALRACELVVVTDLRYRRAERIEALGLEPSRATVVRGLAEFHASACLEVLSSELLPAIAAVREEYGSTAFGESRQGFDFFEAESREALCELDDLTRRRAIAASRVLTEARAAADRAGPGGLCDLLEKHCASLTEIMEERAEHNNPVVAAVGGIVAGIGFLALGLCSAFNQGRGCNDPAAQAMGGFFVAWGLGVILASGGSDTSEDDDFEGGGPL
jgi:hypothetical protein